MKQLEPIDLAHCVTVKTDGAARLLSLSVNKVSEMANAGELPSFKVGSCRLFSVDELKDWARKQCQA